jgi:hypothetical protein
LFAQPDKRRLYISNTDKYINKQIVKTTSDPMNPQPYAIRIFTYCTDKVRTNEVQRVTGYKIKVNFTLEQAVKTQKGCRGVALLFL